MSVVVGICGDLHAPFVHPMYLRFCLDTFRRERVDRVHLIGDVVDAHAISFHEHDPDGHSAGDELELAYAEIQKWKKALPERVSVSIGNHDERQVRAARRAGLTARYLKSYQQLFETPKWDYQFEHRIDSVLYTHGTGNSGKDAAINLAIQRRSSTVMGHTHTFPGVKYHANADSIIFGLQVGVGLDDQAYAFSYGRTFPVKPVLGCGVVKHGTVAQFHPMPCGKGQPYHRSRA